MIDHFTKTLAELDSYIASLSKAELDQQVAKTKDNPQAIFGLIEQGDAVAVRVAQQNDINLEITDNQNMTTLHYAAAHDTRLIFDVLTSEANGTPWVRDKNKRLPLDIAQECGHQNLLEKLERITYPELYLEDKDGPVKTELIEKYDAKRKELGSPSTEPPSLKEARTKNLLRQQIQNQQHKREIRER